MLDEGKLLCVGTLCKLTAVKSSNDLGVDLVRFIVSALPYGSTDAEKEQFTKE